MKLFNLFSAICAASFFIEASADNTIYVNNFYVAAGEEVDVEICIDNEDELNAFNFDLILPSQLSVKLDGGDPVFDYSERTFSKRTNCWSFDVSPEDGYVRIIGNYTKETLNLVSSQDDKSIMILTLVASDAYSGDLCFNNVGAGGPVTIVAPMTYKICKLGASGYASYSSDKVISTAVEISGATAYYGKKSGEVLTLSSVPGNILPKGEGVILRGTPGADVCAVSSVATEAADNDLSSTQKGVDVTPSTVHVLNVVDGVPGFYLYTGSTIGAWKAYLEGVSAARILFDTESAIESVSTENNLEAIFNLQGQKMTEVKKGINIVNGKKVMY